MRVVVHDYSGHPFQVELSRELARRGHDVCHLSCASFVTGKGALQIRDDDPPTFRMEGIHLGAPFAKYSARRRLQQERQYARLLSKQVEAFDPEVVLSSNTPLFAQSAFMHRLNRARHGFVFWVQDIYSIAMANEARRRIPIIGRHMGNAFQSLERRLLVSSDEIIVISDDFRPVLHEWGVPDLKIETIENWAPLGELAVGSRSNPWSREHGLDGHVLAIYSGTLGLKHNPELLAQLAERFARRHDVRVVVISEGLGAEYLAAAKRERSLHNLVLLPFQPYERLTDVFASADLLVAILEPEAGVFSVPSKVLSYHCAGRPILAAIPEQNLAARLITRERTGVLADPCSAASFISAAESLVGDRTRRIAMGQRARSYAERAFDIGSITDRFERVLERAAPVGPERARLVA
jgi:colanic acid biosynthesis glycosyl transferase WcaI